MQAVGLPSNYRMVLPSIPSGSLYVAPSLRQLRLQPQMAASLRICQTYLNDLGIQRTEQSLFLVSWKCTGRNDQDIWRSCHRCSKLNCIQLEAITIASGVELLPTLTTLGR